jgi:hypothetical protein
MTQVTGRKKKSFHTSQFKDTRKIIYIYIYKALNSQAIYISE